MTGDETLDGFLDVFLVSTSERISQIRRMLDSGDLSGAGRGAHTLLGTAGNCGAMELSAVAGELRAACDAGSHDLARSAARKLGDAVDPTSKSIRAWLDQRSGDARRLTGNLPHPLAGEEAGRLSARFETLRGKDQKRRETIMSCCVFRE